MSVPAMNTGPFPKSTPAGSKRVRTGCLTCRQRHLKCDEATPSCMNCRKSKRICKRGIRLNFLEVSVYRPRYIPDPEDWLVDFQDESRQVASEYHGGLGNYDKELQSWQRIVARALITSHPRRFSSWPTLPRNPNTSLQSYPIIDHPHTFTLPPSPPRSVLRSNGRAKREFPRRYDKSRLPPKRVKIEIPSQSPFDLSMSPISLFSTRLLDKVGVRTMEYRMSHSLSDISSAASMTPQVTNAPRSAEQGSDESSHHDESDSSVPDNPANGEREYLGSPEEVYYMQVFVDEVGPWMDSFDCDKHFTQLVPYHALKSPMLLNAFLACGVKHLSLTSQDCEEKARSYYNTATTQLLRSLQNPDRNTAECAAAAVILNIYETMSGRPTHRMNHVAGARALVRECGWDAASTGIGSACFWLNIEMEVLNCLATNWQTTWDPDSWGVKMDLDLAKGESDEIGQEEVWAQQMLYIVARIANFRATAPHFDKHCPCDGHVKGQSRGVLWSELMDLCGKWNHACPRTMHPIGYLYTVQLKSKSCFPKVWLIKRAAVLGRLFYHMAICILGQTNPLEPANTSEEMRSLSLHHARQICGTLAHSTDKSIVPVAVHAIAIAGTALTTSDEQTEAIGILSRLEEQNGWRVQKIKDDLEELWRAGQAHVMIPRASVVAERMAGGGNPLSSADFSLPNHPYQNWYEPPNRSGVMSPGFV